MAGVVQVWPILLKGSGVDIYEAHHTIAISAEVLLVGEQKLLVGQGHVKDSGPKTRSAAAGKQPPTDGWCVSQLLLLLLLLHLLLLLSPPPAAATN